MKHVIYLLVASSATANAQPKIEAMSTEPLTRPNPVPKGNPGNWANANDYPSLALMNEIEGTTGFQLTIGPDGLVTNCTILSSSGSPDLDESTCTNVTRRARFEPALDAKGIPTSGRYANRIRWKIPNSAPQISFPRGPVMLGAAWMRFLPEDFPPKALAEKRQGRVKMELTISSAGAVSGCKILGSSMHPDLDDQSCKLASSRAAFTPALDVEGSPTAGRVQTQVNWRTPGEVSNIINGSPAMKSTIMPKGLLPKVGASSVSYTVRSDGNIEGCSMQSSFESLAPFCDVLSKAPLRFEPYTDSDGKPVARRVTIKTSIQVEDVK